MRLLSVGLLLLGAWSPVQIEWGELPPEEVQILKEFFETTNGTNWEDNTGWLTPKSPCNWYGVVCESRYVEGRSVAHVAAIDLMDNNLTGTLPNSLAELRELRRLDVSLNELTGDVPTQLLARWDDHAFHFRGAKNAFGNMIQRVRLIYSAPALLCAESDDVRYVLDVMEYGPTRFESVRCVPNTDRETHCLVKAGNGPYLERLSRALDQLDYRAFDPEYSYPPLSFVTHQVYITTTVWWGDGTEKTVETYGRQGPIELWMAQQFMLALRHDIYWESEHFEEECKSLKQQ